MNYAKLIGIAAVFFLGFITAWSAQGLRYGAIIALSDKEAAENVATNATATARYLEVTQKQDELNRRDYLARMGDAQNDIKNLRDQLDHDGKRVHVNAPCPAMPATTEQADGANGSSAVLTPDAERNYVDLIANIKRTEALLKYCVGWVDVHSTH